MNVLLHNAGKTPGNFDLVVVNDSLDEAYNILREFLMRELEEHKEDGESSCSSWARSTAYNAVGSYIML
jgi:hypothetical protein